MTRSSLGGWLALRLEVSSAPKYAEETGALVLECADFALVVELIIQRTLYAGIHGIFSSWLLSMQEEARMKACDLLCTGPYCKVRDQLAVGVTPLNVCRPPTSYAARGRVSCRGEPDAR